MSVELKAKVTVYEIDGDDSLGMDRPPVVIRSHWNRGEMVVIEVNGKSVTVVAAQLAEAARRCERIR